MKEENEDETHRRTEGKGRAGKERRRSKKTIEDAGMILDDAELDQVSGGFESSK